MDFKYDQTDIHLRYEKSRKLPGDTIRLWLEAISRYVPVNPVVIIVDLGCGTGRFAKGLSDHFSARVFGIDPSWKMLTTARNSLVSPAIRFIQGTAEGIPLADGVADMIFLSMAYHHIREKDKAVCEFKRVLKAGGFLCIRTSTTDSLDSYPYLQFFPKAYEIGLAKLPSRKGIMDFLQNNDFRLEGHSIIRQITAGNYLEYFEKIRLRGLSDLESLTDEEFFKGLSMLEKYCCEQDTGEPVFEDIELFVWELK